MGRKRSGGFTLIELLVVIAIIAILAAILFPVFAKAREKARQSSCSNNVKQMALGCLSYAQDYDETLPAAWAYCPNPTQTYFGNVIAPYIKNTQIFICPSDAAPTTWGTPINGVASFSYLWNNIQNASGNWPVAVAMGTFSSSPWTSHTGLRSASLYGIGVTLATVQDPSGTLMLFDGNVAGGEVWTDTNADYGTAPVIKPRHNDGFNPAFVDGHVKWRKSGSSKPGDYSSESGD